MKAAHERKLTQHRLGSFHPRGRRPCILQLASEEYFSRGGGNVGKVGSGCGFCGSTISCRSPLIRPPCRPWLAARPTSCGNAGGGELTHAMKYPAITSRAQVTRSLRWFLILYFGVTNGSRSQSLMHQAEVKCCIVYLVKKAWPRSELQGMRLMIRGWSCCSCHCQTRWQKLRGVQTLLLAG
jgi:hypothetical protein